MLRMSSTIVRISIFQLATYTLPPLGGETITAQPIPALCLTGVLDVNNQAGVYSLTILARTATYAGTFFRPA